MKKFIEKELNEIKAIQLSELNSKSMREITKETGIELGIQSRTLENEVTLHTDKNTQVLQYDDWLIIWRKQVTFMQDSTFKVKYDLLKLEE